MKPLFTTSHDRIRLYVEPLPHNPLEILPLMKQMIHSACPDADLTYIVGDVLSSLSYTTAQLSEQSKYQNATVFQEQGIKYTVQIENNCQLVLYSQHTLTVYIGV